MCVDRGNNDVEVDQVTAESRFGWTGFYMEFADRLLAYREDRAPLVEAVHGAFDRHGLPFPRTDQFSDGSTGPLRDICPFTTMGAPSIDV